MNSNVNLYPSRARPRNPTSANWGGSGGVHVQPKAPPPLPPTPALTTTSTTMPAPRIVPQPRRFSHLSTPAVPDSLWASNDFLLGAGMVIIQPSTAKIVVCYETHKKYWFLPKGRKDVGESLEQAALREAYEESGYRASFLPVYNPTRAPSPPSNSSARHERNTEPIYVNVYAWGPKCNRAGQLTDRGGEYLTFWYIGQIEEDAVREDNTGMPDEQAYTSFLYTYEEITSNGILSALEEQVVTYAWHLYLTSDEADKIQEGQERKQETDARELFAKEVLEVSELSAVPRNGSSTAANGLRECK